MDDMEKQIEERMEEEAMIAQEAMMEEEEAEIRWLKEQGIIDEESLFISTSSTFD